MLIYGDTKNAGDRTTLTTLSTEVRARSHDNKASVYVITDSSTYFLIVLFPKSTRTSDSQL